MDLALEKNTGLIYEGRSGYGHPVWPSPLLFQVVIQSVDDEEFKAQKAHSFDPYSLIFREDTYNSASRIRRGRIYIGERTQPLQWKVTTHPALENERIIAANNGGYVDKEVYSYKSFRLRSHIKSKEIANPVFLLGIEDSFTIWTLVNIETSASGEDVISLRARKSVGALPQLNESKFDEAKAENAIELIEKLEDEIYQATPESVIDRAREAATAVLSKYLQNEEKAKGGTDIGELIKKIDEKEHTIVVCSAKILARLHSRVKHAEQEKRALRKITEQDAEYAIQAVGTILCDLGWAEWN